MQLSATLVCTPCGLSEKIDEEQHNIGDAKRKYMRRIEMHISFDDILIRSGGSRYCSIQKELITRIVQGSKSTFRNNNRFNFCVERIQLWCLLVMITTFRGYVVKSDRYV